MKAFNLKHTLVTKDEEHRVTAGNSAKTNSNSNPSKTAKDGLHFYVHFTHHLWTATQTNKNW